MSSDYCCDELRRVVALLERESEIMENKEEYEEAVRMLQGGFDRLRSLKAQQTNLKRGRSDEETTDDTGLASTFAVATEPAKPAKPVKQDNLTIVKTYPFVDLVSEPDAEDDDSVSTEVQAPPRKKVKFAQSDEVITSVAPVATRFQGTPKDIDMMLEKLTTITENKMCPASVRLHLPDAPAIHEHEVIIDALVRPYFDGSRSGVLGAWSKYSDERDRFIEAVENLAKAWAHYFGIDEVVASTILCPPVKSYFLSMWLGTNSDPRNHNDWYTYWVAGQKRFLLSVKPTDKSKTRVPKKD